MMYKDDIQAEIKSLEKNIKRAERKYKSLGMEYWRDYIAIMERQLEAFRNLEKKAPVKRYADRFAALLKESEIKGSKSWSL